MASTIVDSERAVANIFNSAIAAAAIAAGWEVGLLGALKSEEQVDVLNFAERHNLDSDSTQGLAVALASVGVVSIKNTDNQATATPGRLFEEAYRTKSLFHWLTLGSGGLFSRMQHVLHKENRTGDFFQRDGAAIAYACREANRQFFDPVFWTALEHLDYKFHSVVDLGSGSGERLMQILERYPQTTAIGVDVSAAAIKFAEIEAQRRGFGNRLSFTLGDARELEYRDEFAKVDLLTCFLMGHDFWPRENCITSLHRLRGVFPNVTEDNVPIFSLGFEFGHALMNTYIPTMEEWHGVFAEGGWRCVNAHDIPRFTFNVIFELEPLQN